jgi:hypothetical protein
MVGPIFVLRVDRRPESRATVCALELISLICHLWRLAKSVTECRWRCIYGRARAPSCCLWSTSLPSPRSYSKTRLCGLAHLNLSITLLFFVSSKILKPLPCLSSPQGASGLKSNPNCTGGFLSSKVSTPTAQDGPTQISTLFHQN